MKSHTSIIDELKHLGFILSLALLVGLHIGFVGWSIAAGMAAYLVIHFRYAMATLDWLEKKSPPRRIPDVNGVWGELIYRTLRVARKNRKAKKKLSFLLNRFYKTGDALPDATVMLDDQGNIEWFNRAALSMLNLRQHKDYGSKITNLIRHPDFTRYFNRGDFDKTLDIGLLNPDRLIRIRITPYGKNNLLLSAHDVTRMHHVEQMRRDFVANISHELRTPLTVLSGYLEILASGGQLAQEKIQPTLLQMQQQTDRMKSLVEDLLMLSGLENQWRDMSQESEVAVPTLLEVIRDDALILKGNADHEIVLDMDQTLWLRGNAKELQSAFTNLVSNAVRYSPDGGVIRISWKKRKERVVLEVSDTGVGIEAEHIPRLSERFYRVDKGRSQSSGGTGLGLAIVKHVLQRHDGYLEIDSTPGIGSTFRCSFPKSRLIGPVSDTFESDVTKSLN